MNWVLSAICGAAILVLFLRCLSLDCRRPPGRFWLGLALTTPILSGGGLSFAATWHSVFAAWGLWLCVDGLAEACQRPSLLGDQPDAAVWAIVISIFGWAGIEQLNEYVPVWTSLGFTFNPLAREVAIGILGGAVVPTVLSVASLAASELPRPPDEGRSQFVRLLGVASLGYAWLSAESQSTTPTLLFTLAGIALLTTPIRFWIVGNRQYAILAGACFWSVFDSLWSQLGPAQRFYVDFAPEWRFPLILAACAALLIPLYQTAADFLDKPRFDPFRRD